VFELQSPKLHDCEKVKQKLTKQVTCTHCFIFNNLTTWMYVTPFQKFGTHIPNCELCLYHGWLVYKCAINYIEDRTVARNGRQTQSGVCK